jgi:hypothetical protein
MKDFLQDEVNKMRGMVDNCAAQYNVAVGQLRQAESTLAAFLEKEEQPKKEIKEPKKDK